MSLRPSNLILDEGTKVTMRGLTSATELNGKHGEVLHCAKDVDRYAIKLCDDSNKKIMAKPESAIAY